MNKYYICDYHNSLQDCINLQKLDYICKNIISFCKKNNIDTVFIEFDTKLIFSLNSISLLEQLFQQIPLGGEGVANNKKRFEILSNLLNNNINIIPIDARIIKYIPTQLEDTYKKLLDQKANLALRFKQHDFNTSIKYNNQDFLVNGIIAKKIESTNLGNYLIWFGKNHSTTKTFNHTQEYKKFQATFKGCNTNSVGICDYLNLNSNQIHVLDWNTKTKQYESNSGIILK